MACGIVVLPPHRRRWCRLERCLRISCHVGSPTVTIGYPREVVEGTYSIRTFGCQMNEHDSERIAGLLIADGMTPADDVAGSRVVVLNTCAIRENADNKLYGNLGHLKPVKAANPRLRIVVSGCLAQKDQGEIQRRAPWVDVVVGTHALPHLLELLARAETEGLQMDVREYTETFPSALPAARDDAFRAWVSIAPGCDNACTFCIVPLVRGPQRSRAIDDILAEVQGLAAQGVVEVTLLGQNVNTYGRDVTVPGSSSIARCSPSSSADGARSTASAGCDSRARTRTTSRPTSSRRWPRRPRSASTSTSRCSRARTTCSGRMRRSYRRDRYLGWLERIRAAMPGIAVSTDIIVGFPGETERGLRADPRGRGSRAVRQRLHVPVLASAGHEGGELRRPGAQGGRPGAVRPARRAAGRHLDRGSRGTLGGRMEVLVGGRRQEGALDAVADPDEPDRAPGRGARGGHVRPTRASRQRRTHLTGELYATRSARPEPA